MNVVNHFEIFGDTM